MAPRTDIGTKADELRRILVEYNGMPSEKGNKSAYAKVRYIVKRYGEEPSIKSVLQEFNITTICSKHILLRIQNTERDQKISTIQVLGAPCSDGWDKWLMSTLNMYIVNMGYFLLIIPDQ